jgi:hypothetical protein
MMSLMTPPLPADVPATLQTLSDLLSLLADPAAAKQRVAEMQTATAAFQQAADDQKTQIAAFAVAEADHQRAIDAATDEHVAKLAADQATFDTECARRKAELDARAAQIGQLQRDTEMQNDAAAAARADLEHRLALIKSATE